MVTVQLNFNCNLVSVFEFFILKSQYYWLNNFASFRLQIDYHLCVRLSDFDEQFEHSASLPSDALLFKSKLRNVIVCIATHCNEPFIELFAAHHEDILNIKLARSFHSSPQFEGFSNPNFGISSSDGAFYWCLQLTKL